MCPPLHTLPRNKQSFNSDYSILYGVSNAEATFYTLSKVGRLRRDSTQAFVVT